MHCVAFACMRRAQMALLSARSTCFVSRITPLNGDLEFAMNETPQFLSAAGAGLAAAAIAKPADRAIDAARSNGG